MRSLLAGLLVIALFAGCAPRAAPTAPPPEGFRPLLTRVNQARASGGDCGPRGRFAPAPPVAWNERLATAAAWHSRDMSARDFFSHTGSDGSGVAQRATRAGYGWRVVGETLAYATPGRFTGRSVVDAWLQSPGHCATLLEPDFRELGAAVAAARQPTPLEYWTVVLAAPQESGR